MVQVDTLQIHLSYIFVVDFKQNFRYLHKDENAYVRHSQKQFG